MNNVAQSACEGTRATARSESEDLQGQLLHALKLAAGGPFDEAEAANAEDFAECVSHDLAAELLAVAHDDRGLGDLPTDVANHLVTLHAKARAVHLALRMKSERARQPIAADSTSIPSQQVTPSQEVEALLGELLKYSAKAKDDAIDIVTALDRHDGHSHWDGTRQDATHVLASLRNIQDIANELRALLSATAVNDKAAE